MDRARAGVASLIGGLRTPLRAGAVVVGLGMGAIVLAVLCRVVSCGDADAN